MRQARVSTQKKKAIFQQYVYLRKGKLSCQVYSITVCVFRNPLQYIGFRDGAQQKASHFLFSELLDYPLIPLNRPKLSPTESRKTNGKYFFIFQAHR